MDKCWECKYAQLYEDVQKFIYKGLVDASDTDAFKKRIPKTRMIKPDPSKCTCSQEG